MTAVPISMAGLRADGRRKRERRRMLAGEVMDAEKNPSVSSSSNWRRTRAIAEADKLLLTVPNQLSVAYKAHVIEDSNPPRVGFDLWTKGASRHRDVLFMMNDMSMSRIGWRAGLFGYL